jgi:hypothetical protein
LRTSPDAEPAAAQGEMAAPSSVSSTTPIKSTPAPAESSPPETLGPILAPPAPSTATPAAPGAKGESDKTKAGVK